MADLALLIENAERPKGAPLLPGAAKARARQGQRRHSRNVMAPGRSYTDYQAHPRAPKLTDWVEDLSGARWRVTRITADTCWHDLPGEPVINCPIKFLKIVDGPAPERAPSVAPPAPDGRFAACEALYQGIWDAYEVQDWAKLETALRAYEATLAALGI